MLSSLPGYDCNMVDAGRAIPYRVCTCLFDPDRFSPPVAHLIPVWPWVPDGRPSLSQRRRGWTTFEAFEKRKSAGEPQSGSLHTRPKEPNNSANTPPAGVPNQSKNNLQGSKNANRSHPPVPRTISPNRSQYFPKAVKVS